MSANGNTARRIIKNIKLKSMPIKESFIKRRSDARWGPKPDPRLRCVQRGLHAVELRAQADAIRKQRARDAIVLRNRKTLGGALDAVRRKDKLPFPVGREGNLLNAIPKQWNSMWGKPRPARRRMPFAQRLKSAKQAAGNWPTNVDRTFLRRSRKGSTTDAFTEDGPRAKALGLAALTLGGISSKARAGKIGSAPNPRGAIHQALPKLKRAGARPQYTPQKIGAPRYFGRTLSKGAPQQYKTASGWRNETPRELRRRLKSQSNRPRVWRKGQQLSQAESNQAWKQGDRSLAATYKKFHSPAGREADRKLTLKTWANRPKYKETFEGSGVPVRRSGKTPHFIKALRAGKTPKDPASYGTYSPDLSKKRGGTISVTGPKKLRNLLYK